MGRRNSGATFLMYQEKASEYFYRIQIMLHKGEYLKYEKLNYFSKCVYLWYINDNKTNPAKQPVENYCIDSCILDMFRRNLDKIYKPLAELLRENLTINN